MFRNFFVTGLVCAMLGLFLPGAMSGQPPVWCIGTQNGSAIEFAPGERRDLTFTVGKSVVSKDFAGHQSGSVAADGKVLERPYTMQFDLAEPPSGEYELALDLIYRHASPAQMKIVVNDKTGIFPIQPAPKHSEGGEEGNEMLLTRQQVIVPIPSAWLQAKGNKITLTPLGVGALAYDAISFLHPIAPPMPTAARLEPTVFFRKRDGKLVEVCNLVVPFAQRFDHGAATVKLGKQTFTATLTNSLYDFGLWIQPMEIPVANVTGEANIKVTLADKTLTASCQLKPAKQWKIFVCPKVHNDVGYTDLQPHVNELDNRNTDTVLEILRRYPYYKFNFETSWLVENYLDCRTAPWREQFFDFAKRNRIGINTLYLNLLTGLCTGEELYRAMYFTHRLHRERGSDFDFACLTDAPSHTWFLPTLLRDTGVKAFSNGANQTRAPILHYSDLNEDSPYWWEGMNGERVFMWYARSYVQLKRLTAAVWTGGSSTECLQRNVRQFLARYLRDNYTPDALMIYGAYVDNAAIPANGDAPVIEAWNKEFEFPKLIVATDADYFNYVEKHFADKLPVYRGDCGAYWEDGCGSTMHATLLNREAKRVLPAAETAAALATIFEPRNRYPAEDFRGVWKNVMFYDEHTWGAHNSISQPGRQFVERQWEIKEDYASRANLDARNLLARGCNRLAQQIAVDGSSILAFNWQSHPRTAPLEIELGSGEQLVDLADNKVVPMDVYFERDGWRKLRFLARDVPPMGYKAYAIRHFDKVAHQPNADVEGDTIENQFYRLTVDARTGGLKSLFDKTAKRELLDASSPYKLNEYLYVSGGEGSLILNFTFGTPPANLTIHEPEKVAITKIVKTPLGQRLTVETKSKNTSKVASEYLLYEGIKRVDIVNTVDKDEVRTKEAVYFVFPFAAQTPAMEYQIQNGWCRPNDDQMPGACREWFTPQNLVHVRDGEFSVALATPDVPLVTLTDINRGKWLDHLPIKNGHVYSYAMNNYWFTNYRAQQGGRFVFRYSITSGWSLDRETLARFDQDTRTPVVAYPFLSSFSAAISQTDRPMPASGGSFLTCDAPNLEMVTLKEAEDGDGFILRFRETAGRSGEIGIKTPVFRIREAWLCNGVEDRTQKLVLVGDMVRVPYKPHAFATVRLKAERSEPDLETKHRR